MRLRLRFSLILTIVVAALVQACSRPLPPQESCGFVQNPEMQRVSWKKNLPLKLYLHNSVPTEAYPAIDRAIKEYNEKVAGGVEVLRIVGRGASGDMTPARDGYSMVYWFKTWDPARPTEQARTTIYWQGAEIFEADVRVNAYNFRYYFGDSSSFSDVDLDSLLVHEFGHALGLAHNQASGSVMNVTLDEGQERRKLGQIDMNSLKCEY